MAANGRIGLLTVDRDLIIRSVNPWLVAATGVSEDEARERHVETLFPDDRRERCLDILREVLETGMTRVLAPAFHHYVFACPPAQPSPHFDRMQQHVTVAPLRADGAIAGLIVTVEDVTPELDRQRDLAARLRAPDGSVAAADALAAVRAPDWRMRGEAVRALKVASQADLAHLLASLQRDHQDLNVLSSALQVLTATGHEVVPALVELLGDSSANLRMHAALALGELRDTVAAPALIRALEDEDVNVRFHAIEALGKLAVPEAVEPLASIAESADLFLAFPAIDALARTDDIRVARRLTALLGNDFLRPPIVETLGSLGDEDCVRPLVDLINTRRGDPVPVAAALQRIRDRYEETLGDGAQIVLLTRAALLPDGVRALRERLHTRVEPLRPLVVVLGWLSADSLDVLLPLLGLPGVLPEATQALLSVGAPAVPGLIDLLEQGERQARLGAVALLGQLGDRRAVPALAAVLRSPDAELTATAAGSLAALGDARALNDVFELFRHQHAGVRQAAIAAVNSIGSDETLPRIRAYLLDPDPRIRECAIRVAGYFGYDECIPAIFDALRDADEDVRRAAIEQLPVIDDERASRSLEMALRSETPRNRAAAAHASRTTDDAMVRVSLIDALQDPDPWVRYFSAGSLARRGDRPAVAALARTATDDAAPHVRIAAVEALGVLDTGAVLSVAQRLARDPDDDVACAALAAVARTEDAGAHELLEWAVRTDRDALRLCAIEALASRPGEQSVETLAWAAQLNTYPALVAAALAGLGALASRGSGASSRSAVGALVALAAGGHAHEDAIKVLAALPEPAIDLVAGALKTPVVAERLTAVDTLVRMRHPRASQALVPALADDDRMVRAAAVTGFGRLGTPVAKDALIEMARSDADETVRARAEAVCRRFGWSA